MLKTTSAWSLVLLFSVAAFSKQPTVMERAKVISQDIGSGRAGAVAAPIGTMVVAVPIYRSWNRVVVETDRYRYEWSEVGNKLITLPVNGVIEFYRDGDWFVVLDSKHKRHKFAVVGMTVKEDGR